MYKTGAWGPQAKERSKNRLQYFLKASNGYRSNNHLKVEGERIAAKLLPGAKYVDTSSHDYEWRGLKIEVKYSSEVTDRGSKFFAFHITNPKQTTDSDYFLCIGNRGTIYLIPTTDIRVSHTIKIPVNPKRHSKYDQYLCKPQALLHQLS